MASQPNTTVCGLPPWIAFPANDTTSYINDVVAAAINLPICIFTFLSNLAIIVIVTRRPQLQRPNNILLCSLAFTDCVTGVTSQPFFFVWRLRLYRARQSCDFQIEFTHARLALFTLTTGWSFCIITLISFDRAYALTNPLIYRATITSRVAITAASITLVVWALLIVLTHVVSDTLQYIIRVSTAVLLILVPIINHIRMFLSIRRHNNQVIDAVGQQQQLLVLRREKKVASDMLVVSMALLACLGPLLAIQPLHVIVRSNLYDLLYPWAFAMAYANSFINPILYVTRNKEIRSALKAAIPFC